MIRLKEQKKTWLECFEPVEKKSGQSNNFWMSYGSLKYVYISLKMSFFWNNSKNIGIWILRKEQNLFRSEFYMCVPSVVKLDWEIPAKNSRWPPWNLVFFTFQHQTLVISRASSRSPWSSFVWTSSIYGKLVWEVELFNISFLFDRIHEWKFLLRQGQIINVDNSYLLTITLLMSNVMFQLLPFRSM